jgi:ATP-dependent Clp protease adaptor protein ClpS
MMLKSRQGRTHISVTEHRQGTVLFRMLEFDEREAEAAALNGENGWIGIEMVKTVSRPLSQQQNPNPVRPIEKPELDLLEKEDTKAKRPSMWNIVFYNDDYTPMDFVEYVLRTVLHLSTLDALALTLVVHTKGKGIAGTYTFEVAEQKQCEVLLMAKDRGASIEG